jgi:hypothetical protein
MQTWNGCLPALASFSAMRLLTSARLLLEIARNWLSFANPGQAQSL